MAATLKDVAKLAKVHSSTVSRVLRGNDDLRIPEETQQKIIRAAKELNYYPDQTARSLRLKKSFSIGLIVPDITNPFKKKGHSRNMFKILVVFAVLTITIATYIPTLLRFTPII